MNLVDPPIPFQMKVGKENVTPEMDDQVEMQCGSRKADNERAGKATCITGHGQNSNYLRLFQVWVAVSIRSSDFIAGKPIDPMQGRVEKVFEIIECQQQEKLKEHWNKWGSSLAKFPMKKSSRNACTRVEILFTNCW